MTNYSELKQQVKTNLSAWFPNVDVEITEVNYCGLISVVFIKCPSPEKLAEVWEEISNAVAIYYQTKLKSEFERWNLYLFYLVPQEVEKGLKYRIENDPVSSRKIVVDKFQGELDEAAMDLIINDHITNLNLDINAVQPAPLAFTKHSIFGPEIDALLSTTSKAKTKNTTEITDLLKKLEDRFKNEI